MEKSKLSENLFHISKFLIKCFYCENFIDYLTYKKNIYVCNECRISNELTSSIDIKHLSHIFLDVFSEVSEKEQKVKAFLNEFNPKSDFEKSLEDKEKILIQEIDNIISHLTEIKTKIKTKSKKVLEKFSTINNSKPSQHDILINEDNYLKNLKDKLNKISDGIKNDSSIFNELRKEDIEDTKNIQFFLANSNKYIQKYILYSVDLKEIITLIKNSPNRISEDKNEEKKCFFEKELEVVYKLKDMCHNLSINSEIIEHNNILDEEKLNLKRDFTQEKKSKNKILLDNLLIDISAYGSSKYADITDFIIINSEIDESKYNSIDFIPYNLKILFKSIRTSHFSKNLQRECFSIEQTQINKNMVANTKLISFEDCYDTSFLDFLLLLDPYLLSRANEIKFYSNSLNQNSGRILLNFIFAKLLLRNHQDRLNKLNPPHKNNYNLSTINISNCRINVKSILNLFKYIPIKKLFLVDNSVNDKDLETISFFFLFEKEKIYKPTDLNLFNNRITDKGFQSLFSLVGSLDLINLNNNLLTDKSIQFMLDNNPPDIKRDSSFYLMNCLFENLEVLKELNKLNDKIYLYLSCSDIPDKIKKKMSRNIIWE